ncbi:super-infection exclusion protein B (plasmid) [Carnobacterium maltaromaticum]|uniref:super-infection exclusion protein B n=1 Tax=Carnobacterium maltaromaticum TaxID=2751 RepID=UPI00344E5AA8
MITIEKVIEFLNNPLNKGILWGAGSVSFILLLCNMLLSPEQLSLLFIDSLLNKYGWLLPLILLMSLVFLIIGFVSGKIKLREDKKFNEHMEIKIKDLFEDEQDLDILKQLYTQHPNPQTLNSSNQKVKLLEHYGLIMKATTNIMIRSSQLSNPPFPYILQPIAEKKLKEMYANRD